MIYNLFCKSDVYFVFEGTVIHNDLTFNFTFMRISSIHDNQEKREVNVRLDSSGWKDLETSTRIQGDIGNVYDYIRKRLD